MKCRLSLPNRRHFERGDRLRVRLYADRDPVTGKDVYLIATIKGTDKAAQKRAEDKLAEFRTKVLKQRNAPTSVTMASAVNEWLRTSDVEDPLVRSDANSPCRTEAPK